MENFLLKYNKVATVIDLEVIPRQYEKQQSQT